MYYTPHNNEAEQGLLGALLVDNRCLEQISDFFRAEYFYLPVHRRIYEAIVHLIDSGRGASPVTMKGLFQDDGDLKKVGGAAYLADLAANVVSVINTEDYARTVMELWTRREIIDVASGSIGRAQKEELGESSHQIIEGLEEGLFAIAETEKTGGPEALSTGLHSAMNIIESAQKGERVGMKTGIAALDDLNGGFLPGQMITVAARPSMGKTAFAMTIAHNVAARLGKVLFFSMEMTKEEIAQRLYARYTGYATGHQLRPGAFKSEDFAALMDAGRKLAQLPLSIDEGAHLAPAQIRARARRHKRRHGLDLIMIDYLNIMKMPERYVNPVDQIAQVTKEIKALAKDMGVPVVLLAQLNRDVEKREDKRPNMADLRASGAIEENSDVVLLLHREEYYLEREGLPKQKDKETDEQHAKNVARYHDRCDRARGKADVIIGKWRMGKVRDVRCGFNGTRQFFHDLEDI